MKKSVGLIAAFSKPEAAELASHVRSHLESQGCVVVPEQDLTNAKPGELLAIVVLGGDGLMMRSAMTWSLTLRSARIEGERADGITAARPPRQD